MGQVYFTVVSEAVDALVDALFISAVEPLFSFADEAEQALNKTGEIAMLAIKSILFMI
jgi:hypothetical protein